MEPFSSRIGSEAGHGSPDAMRNICAGATAANAPAHRAQIRMNQHDYIICRPTSTGVQSANRGQIMVIPNHHRNRRYSADAASLSG